MSHELYTCQYVIPVLSTATHRLSVSLAYSSNVESDDYLLVDLSYHREYLQVKVYIHYRRRLRWLEYLPLSSLLPGFFEVYYFQPSSSKEYMLRLDTHRIICIRDFTQKFMCKGQVTGTSKDIVIVPSYNYIQFTFLSKLRQALTVRLVKGS